MPVVTARPSRSAPPRPVADVLSSAVPRLAERLVEYRLARAWGALVGPDVARRARPQSVLNGCLTIVVDNSPWLQELTLRSPSLLERVHGVCPDVRSLRFALGSLEPDAPSRAEPRPRREPLSAADRRETSCAAAGR